MVQHTWFKVQYHVQCLAVVGHLLVQPSQVEFVLNVVLIHLGKEEWKGEELGRRMGRSDCVIGHTQF